jgi:hypothetical protein
MQAIIDFLVSEIKNKDGNDPAQGYLYNILEIVLLSNFYQTDKYINEIVDIDTYWIISNHFGFISGQRQEVEFIRLIKYKTEKFKGIAEEKYYERFCRNVQEAIEALDINLNPSNKPDAPASK